ncbi:uncharacterized protein HMPREF1541_01206 [Cyphellophora europaea CBS 101466]|uniref:Uncharacterized protein n=1 Tax=Cyphellophora europaea (strain CBS 101466) TaxID=1220924 RepID=W2SE62_CYPE1|nr:uncharacterized protein HMPREF1541_01206 [Cyphellophora europaea CBS 101466]ETN47016.1 hypothetical protein HMPREF1541_01206 [Cyphellophora europaea CBS 101466]
MKPFTSLLIAIPILMIVSIIELSFISAMVGFLHGRANGFFVVDSPGSNSNSGPDTFELWAKPSVLLEDQGHTSNGAAGTGFILIGIGGLLMIWWERRRMRETTDTRPGPLFTTWLILSFLGTLLTLAALIYTFVLTQNHTGQTIDLAIAAANPAPSPYPDDEWTPENWYQAVLDQVPLRDDSDRRKIRQQLRIQRGWRWNLVPFFIVFTVVTCLGAWEWLRLRRNRGASVVAKGEKSGRIDGSFGEESR